MHLPYQKPDETFTIKSMKSLLEGSARKYFLSFLVMIVAVILQYLVITLGNTPVPGILYPMAFLIAWYWGFGPVVMTIFFSLIASNLFFYEPRFSFKIVHFSDYVRLGIFAVTSLVAAWIVARGRRAEQGELKARSELGESLDVLETINSVNLSMSAELDQKKLVQQVTDAGRILSKAEFGAFFYNTINDSGEILTLYTVSGVPREAFDKFPMPRNTAIFAPTFYGEGIIRSDDITKDPRYGKNAPYHGMPKGHLPVVSYLAIPVKSRSGEVIGGLFFGHTKPGVFTEREERIVSGLASQAAVAMDNARLFDQANQAILIRDEFLSISSHELRTPLTPLKIQLQVLSMHIEKGTYSDLSIEQLRKMLALAEKQVNRITVLVDDLLDVTRISSGKLTLNIEEVEMVELIKEVVDRYKTQLQTAQCDVHLNLVDSVFAHIDRIRFEQVFVNLLTNAIKYAAGKPITITLKVEDQIVLIVSDRGIGISEIDHKRIFDRFERANSNTAQGGLGLGLYIVDQIVKAHNGTIEMESQKGKGTTFTVKLPR